MNLFKKAITVLFFIALFFLYSIFKFKAPHLFSWPDEMANFFFASEFANTGKLKVIEPLNHLVGNILMPRSMNLVNGDYVSVGFLGLPILFGLVGAFVPDWWMVFFTPIISIIGLMYFYKIVKSYFSEMVAIGSTVVLALTPAWIYYSSMSMLPNILMSSLFIISTYYLIEALKSKQQVSKYIISGIFLGLGLMVRPSEILLVLPLIIGLVIYFRKNIKIKYWFYFFIPSLVLGFIYLIINKATYGGWLITGYSLELNPNESGITESSQGIIHNLVKIIFPFGLSLKTIFNNYVRFVIPAHWPLLILTIPSLVYFYFDHKYKNRKVVFASIIWVAVFLTAYYCSWSLVDIFVLTHSKLGVSFNRYLLPVFVAIIPFVVSWIWEMINEYTNWKRVAFCLVILAYSIFGVQTSFFSGNDSLIKVHQSVIQGQELRTQILGIVPEQGVIISLRNDKNLFSERKIITQYTQKDLQKVKNLISSGYPVYYLIFQDLELIKTLNKGIFNEEGLIISNQLELKYGHYLYEVKFK